MNQYQKDELRKLRLQGVSYAMIAARLKISENTVKSYCRRNGLQSWAKDLEGVCPQCGKELSQRPKCKPRRFCTDACRHLWWKSHRDTLRRKAVCFLECHHCNKTFESYTKAYRKYCCHKCYIADRFRGEGHNDTRTL